MFLLCQPLSTERVLGIQSAAGTLLAPPPKPDKALAEAQTASPAATLPCSPAVAYTSATRKSRAKDRRSSLPMRHPTTDFANLRWPYEHRPTPGRSGHLSGELLCAQKKEKLKAPKFIRREAVLPALVIQCGLSVSWQVAKKNPSPLTLTLTLPPPPPRSLPKASSAEALVAQEPVLFNTSVRQNLLLLG